MLAQHVERLPPDFVRRVPRHLQLELRRGESRFLHHVEDDERERVVRARAVLVRAAEVEGVAPVVVDGPELPDEVAEFLAELGLRGAPRREVGLVVRPPAHVDVVERAHLEVVERLGEDEVHHRELHDVKNRLRRPHAQALERGDFLPHPRRIRVGMRLRRHDQAVEEAHHRGGGLAFSAVERRVPRVGIGARLHAGETEFQDVDPVRRGVVEVLADRGTTLLVHLGDGGAKAGRILVVNVRRMAPEDGAHRTAMAVPRGNGRKPVVLREPDRDVVHKVVEAPRGHVVPVLLAGFPARFFHDFHHPRAERIVVHARLRVGEVRAPFPLEVRRLVGNRRRTLFRPCRVLVPSVIHRHATIRDLHPGRQYRRHHQSCNVHRRSFLQPPQQSIAKQDSSGQTDAITLLLVLRGLFGIIDGIAEKWQS